MQTESELPRHGVLFHFCRQRVVDRLHHALSTFGVPRGHQWLPRNHVVRRIERSSHDQGNHNPAQRLRQARNTFLYADPFAEKVDFDTALIESMTIRPHVAIYVDQACSSLAQRSQQMPTDSGVFHFDETLGSLERLRRNGVQPANLEVRLLGNGRNEGYPLYREIAADLTMSPIVKQREQDSFLTVSIQH